MRTAYLPTSNNSLLCYLHSTHLSLLSLLQVDQVFPVVILFPFFFFACSSPRSERTTDLYPLGFASNVPWAVPQYTLTTSLLHILFLSSQDSPLSVLNCSMFGFLIIFHELFEGTWLAHSCTLGPSSPRPSINTYWRMKEFWTLTFPLCSLLFPLPEHCACFWTLLPTLSVGLDIIPFRSLYWLLQLKLDAPCMCPHTSCMPSIIVLIPLHCPFLFHFLPLSSVSTGTLATLHFTVHQNLLNGWHGMIPWT